MKKVLITINSIFIPVSAVCILRSYSTGNLLGIIFSVASFIVNTLVVYKYLNKLYQEEK